MSTGRVVLALLVLVSSCAAQDRANPHTNTPGGTPEHEVRAALSDLGDAVHHQDLDEIVAFFAPDYASQRRRVRVQYVSGGPASSAHRSRTSTSGSNEATMAPG